MVGTNNANHQPSLIHSSSGENSSNPIFINSDADIVIVTTSHVTEATNASPKTNPVLICNNYTKDLKKMCLTCNQMKEYFKGKIHKMSFGGGIEVGNHHHEQPESSNQA
ncbi:hypothetical protein PCANC_18877 [Puccinia coronata f. sp. avenae]|uniref:Uncharacterized protein n=1 Tax=Puccinia coronata f. sp. avenae TaxID=200324 RepID=A0A2N5V7R0_9BASI|nr:hypothetical protein PCANC_18877 [Puccinia coronata f. sp. avenae]PLW46045.1 hypothetical protein PCASD_03527 [Puccinia coronata f. sp. avenae]